MEDLEYLKSIGLSLIENFISIEEEEFILSKLNKKSNVKKNNNRNSIERYGSSKPYNSNMISNTIPEHFLFLFDRLVDKQYLSEKPNHISINEYLKGQEIAAHIDSKNSGEIISVLSLMNHAIMVFSKKGLKHKVLLPSRSLVQMRDEIRNDWMHAIEPVVDVRYSLVFRKG